MNGRDFERFVFTDLPEEKKPVPAGLFTLDHDSGVGRFRYGNRYLERPNAKALDPVNLPLSPQEYVTRKNKGRAFSGRCATCSPTAGAGSSSPGR